MTRALRSPRRTAVIVVLIVGALVGLPTAVLGQTDDAGGSEATASAILSQDGWWNRAQGPQEGEPANPLRPIIGGTVPAPSTVPATAIAVGALLGEPDKVAAVGFVLDAPLDAFVDRLVLQLKESTAANANTNAASAAIVACPITDFWASAKNGDFAARPACDDGQSAPGVRSPDGTWTFDLATFASSWVDGSLSQNGVLLKEAVDAPASFQVSFDDLSTGRVTLDFAATGGGFSGSSDFTFDDTDSSFTTTDDAPADDVGSFDDTASFDSASSFESGATFSSGGTSTAATVPAPAAQVATPTASSPVQAVPAASTRLFGALPVPALLLLALLVLGGALFLGLVLGPLAAPVAAPSRSGGVSRALAERDASTRR